ncbi:Uncharacterised protein [Mycolicibacterium tokaiense]|uniref:Uncharacterized protein n=1 Tax=Mycolicibacterium tokaiense TaxID=39695 RepID=A0A378TA50_9MYCO|nr:Uncharacterised protein [Mycolicibacterium tokaiense]
MGAKNLDDVRGDVTLSEPYDVCGHAVVRGKTFGDFGREPALAAFKSRQLRRRDANVCGGATQ